MIHGGRSGDGPAALFAFDVEALRARSRDELVEALARAEQARDDAERARVDAERARVHAERLRQELVAELDAVTSDRDALAASQKAIWTEKRVLENEVDALLRRIAELSRQLAQATGADQFQQLSLELAKLNRQLDDRNRTLFGTRSERRRKSGDGDNDGDDEPEKPRRKKRSGSRRTPQPQLTVEPVHHRLTAEDCAKGCGACHEDISEIKGLTDDSEEVTIVRPRFKMRVHQRHKYRCGNCGWMRTAPGPLKLMPGGRYSPEFAVQVAVDKFEDNIALTRQVRRMHRAGLVVRTTTLLDQLHRLYVLLLPTLLALHQRILDADLVFADETPWRLIKKGGSKKWWAWIISDGVRVYYQFVSSRGAAAARLLLRDYAGILMADDYVVYNALEKARTKAGGAQTVIDEDGQIVEIFTPDFTLAGCWMHARRYLFKAEKYHPEAGHPLDLIDDLYQVEVDAKQEALTAAGLTAADFCDALPFHPPLPPASPGRPRAAAGRAVAGVNAGQYLPDLADLRGSRSAGSSNQVGRVGRAQERSDEHGPLVEASAFAQ